MADSSVSCGDEATSVDLPYQLEAAAYPAVEAGRLIGLSASRVRRWLKGYQYRYGTPDGHESVRRQKPVVHRADVCSRYASFLDLIDLLFVKNFLDYGISLQKLRKALDEATRILNTRHFAWQTFFTDGRSVYLQVKDSGDDILELLSGGQWVIAPVIRELGHCIEFDEPTGLARRWYPWGKDGLIVIDPLVAFGSPTIRGRGITTAVIHDFYLGEKGNIGQICSWYDLNVEEVRAAVKFEESIAA